MKGVLSAASLARSIPANSLVLESVSTRLSMSVMNVHAGHSELSMPLNDVSVLDFRRPRAFTFGEFSFTQDRGRAEAREAPNLSLSSRCLMSYESVLPNKSGLLVSLSPGSYVDPALRSADSQETAKLALAQTLAARNLLYAPGHVLIEELGKVAKTLHGLINELGPEDQLALGARLFGSEGLLPDQSPEVLIGILARVSDDYLLPHKSNSTSAKERAVVIALMGDIGALYADTGATTGVEGRSPAQAEILRENLRNLMESRGLSAPVGCVIDGVQRLGGSSVVGPQKKVERIRPPAELTQRTGIHNTGESADIKLGIASDHRIPTAKWDVAHISKDRVFAVAEPLVGHMSGSPAEILQVWDMLRGDPHEIQFVGVLNKGDSNHWDPLAEVTLERQDQQIARAAGAAAFLIGLGYHSAVEVAEGVLLYMGQNLREVLNDPTQDAGHLLGGGAATSLMSELFNDQSKVL